MSYLFEALQVKNSSKKALFSKPNVVGMGVGYKITNGILTDQLSIVVMVREKTPVSGLRTEDIIPQALNQIPTDIVAVGDVQPLLARTDRWRPAPGGVSLGHYKITAGTLGCIVYDQITGNPLILSNNHVLANRNEAKYGDPILQPGPADGGQISRDMIAILERFHPIKYNSSPATCEFANFYVRMGNFIARKLNSSHQIQAFRSDTSVTNEIDAAVARPVEESVILAEDLEIGEIDGTMTPSLDMAVRKSGRSTSYTTGVITILDASVQINYGEERKATFDHQIVTSPMSKGGDSGSLLVAKDSPKAVGLLFAGSELATIHNPIEAVLSQLKITFKGSNMHAKSGRRVMLEKIQAVKESNQDTLMQKQNVVGVGIGQIQSQGVPTKQVGLIVMVSQKIPEDLLAPQDRIPAEIDGVPIEVREIGDIHI
jgi:hypothetical protein